MNEQSKIENVTLTHDLHTLSFCVSATYEKEKKKGRKGERRKIILEERQLILLRLCCINGFVYTQKKNLKIK